MLYSITLALHVLIAVLGIGLVGAIPVAARLAQRPDVELAETNAVLGVLLRAMGVGLGGMLLTGVVLDLAAAGAFHGTGWFRASIALLVVIGFSLTRARAALRRGALRGLERWGWVMCGSVALVTILMETKLLA